MLIWTDCFTEMQIHNLHLANNRQLTKLRRTAQHKIGNNAGGSNFEKAN